MEAKMIQLEKHVKYLEEVLNENKIKFEPLVLKASFVERQASKADVYFESNVLNKLTYDEIERYKRQMLLKEITIEGQVKLNRARVLVVGAGGIGGPAALYLAASGIGTIGIIDGDNVEISNLHRQIIHTTERVGMSKVLSAQIQINQINPLIKVETHQFNLNPDNAVDIFSKYDIVLDATDNPQTRYLINDACVILNKPLVSGSAVGWEGQLSVFHYKNGPCYRCLFPDCPKGVKNCSEAGVFGVLPGVIGLLEVLEAVKIILEQGQTLSQKMLLIDGLQGSFKVARLRNKQIHCQVCGENPIILDVKNFDYIKFAATCSVVIPPSENYENITWQDLQKVDPSSIFIDCRPKEQRSIIHFPLFEHIQWTEFQQSSNEEVAKALKNDPTKSIFIMCRGGNQSRLMCDFLHTKGYKNLHNVIGGLNRYAKDYDPDMPLLQ